MHDLHRFRYVTERYPHLQGLRVAPLGVPFLVSAAWRRGQLSWVPGTSGHGPGYWFLGLMALAFIVSIALARYYRQRFGSVQPARRLEGPLLFCGFLAVFFASTWAQDQFSSAVALPAVVIGVALGYLGVAGGHLRTHYIALAAVCLGFATLGTFGVPVHARDVLLDDLVGVGLIVIGVGDHLLLRRTLEPVMPNVEAI
jgi:hypothetical protein